MPTSSQHTNTIATLPATTRPNMLKQNSERHWKKRRSGRGGGIGRPSLNGARASLTSASSPCM